MKKKWTLILSVCLAVCVLCSGFALTACDSERKKLDLTISNYAEYDGLMAGVPNDSYVSPAAKTVFRAEAYKEKKKMPKLYGRRKDGSYEQIEFEEENDITTKYGLSCIQQAGEYIFLTYTKNYPYEWISNIFSSDCNSEQYSFLLDTGTGKLFDISEYQFCALDGFGGGMVNGALYCRMWTEGWTSSYLCRVSIIDNELKIEQLIDLSLMPEFWGFSLDKYGNIYSGGYIYTQSGIVKRLDQPFLIAANGIAYLEKQTIDDETGETVSSWGEWINSEGEPEEAEYIPKEKTMGGSDTWNSSELSRIINSFDYRVFRVHSQECDFRLSETEEYFIHMYQEDNVYYCLDRSDSIIDNSETRKIIKYEFLDDVRYDVELIDLEKGERWTGLTDDIEKAVFAGERVYFLNSEEVYYINMKDGSAHTLSSGYIFKKIYSDNQGGIIFEGLDERLNTVTGMIGADDSVTVGITPREYEIFYIASLN